MRSKSEEKRQKIIDKAAEIFREHGFDSTSMSEICANVGGSKATIYNYFKSKEEIFVCTVKKFADNKKRQLQECLQDNEGNPRDVLTRYATNLLELITRPEIISARRMVCAPTIPASLANEFYNQGPKVSQDRLTEYMEGQMKSGKLRNSNPKLAATQFQSLIAFPTYDKVMFQIKKKFSAEEIEAIVSSSVDMFMSYYGLE